MTYKATKMRVFLLLLVVVTTATFVQADTLTWDGGGDPADADTTIGNAVNWVGDVAFTDGDDLIFFDAANVGTEASLGAAATINSITFDANSTTSFTLLGLSSELTLSTGVTVEAGSVNHTINSQVTILNDVTFTHGADVNNGLTLNARIKDDGTDSGILYQGVPGVVGRYVLNDGRAPNSSYAGGTTIENASVSVLAVFPGLSMGAFTRSPFGVGEIILGQSGSSEFAEVVVASTANNNGLVFNDIRVNPGSGERVFRSGNGTNMRLNGALVGSGALTFRNGTTVLENEDEDSTFDGRVILDNGALQVRNNNAFGALSTVVEVGDSSDLTDAGQLRAFIESPSSGAIAIDNPIDFYAGNIGIQGTGTGANFVAAPSADINSDISIMSSDQLDLLAQLSTSMAQSATLNFSGDITGGDASAEVRFVAGTGADGETVSPSALAGSSAQFNMSGNYSYANSTRLDGRQLQTGDLLTVTLSGSLGNSNIEITDNAVLEGDSGSLTYNVNGSTGDLITVDGTLDISSLTLDLDLNAATETSYVIADFTNGTLVGTDFASIVDLPSGASINIGLTQITLDGLTPSVLAGDYNNDGFVSAADYAVGRASIGAAGGTLPNDPSGADPIDAAQIAQWAANFGSGTPPAPVVSAAVVPEPSTLVAILAAAAVGCCRRSARTRRA